MLRSAIDWHSTSLKILLEVSMLVAPAVDRRISDLNACIGIPALWRLRHQHVEVGHRLAQHLVENIVGGLDAGRACRRSAHLRSECLHRDTGLVASPSSAC